MSTTDKSSAWAMNEAKRLSHADWSDIAPTFTAALATILDAARLEGVKLGLEAGAKECDSLHNETVHNWREPRLGLGRIARNIRSLSPAAILSTHDKETPK